MKNYSLIFVNFYPAGAKINFLILHPVEGVSIVNFYPAEAKIKKLIFTPLYPVAYTSPSMFFLFKELGSTTFNILSFQRIELTITYDFHPR